MDQKTKEKPVPDELSELVVNYCDPLFISDRNRIHQSNVRKSNGTITYINYKNQLWGVTAAHVANLKNPKNRLTLCGCGTQPVYIAKSNTYGGFRLLRKNEDDKKNPDIAILKISNEIKINHFDSNLKKAIDLEKWEKPDTTEEIITPVAFGFPTEHKTQQGRVTLSDLVLVAGYISNKWSFYNDGFSFHAELQENSEYFLSGMSGGPIFHAEDREHDPLLIGIVYQGTPGGKYKEPPGLGMNNVFVFGHTLTPDIFDTWLYLAGFDS